MLEVLDTEVQAAVVAADVDKDQLPAFEAQQAEKAGTTEEALTQLASQIPQPNPVSSGASERSLLQFALLT